MCEAEFLHARDANGQPWHPRESRLRAPSGLVTKSFLHRMEGMNEGLDLESRLKVGADRTRLDQDRPGGTVYGIRQHQHL